MGEPKGFIVVPIGFGPSDDLRSLELDTDDNLKVAFAAAAQGLVGPHGWINGAWQKNPVSFGASAALGRSWSTIALPAGNSFVADSAVPAGEIWVITHQTAWVVSATITRMRFFLNISGVNFETWVQITPGSDVRYDRQGWWVLFPGDFMQLRVESATLNDDASAVAAGFRVDIDQ
jgi:hypothetical protein